MKKERNTLALFLVMMTIAFLAMLTLKSTGVIELSWLLVTSPLWISGIVLLLLVLIVCIAALIAYSEDYDSEDYYDDEY